MIYSVMYRLVSQPKRNDLVLIYWSRVPSCHLCFDQPIKLPVCCWGHRGCTHAEKNA